MTWTGYVTRMGRAEVYTGFWWANLRKRDHLEDPGKGGNWEYYITMDLQ
jgi:hypothetical protein